MTSVSAQCGHVKRRLGNNEPLEGKTLDFALSVIENAEDELVRGIAAKLKAAENLTDYEYHGVCGGDIAACEAGDPRQHTR